MEGHQKSEVCKLNGELKTSHKKTVANTSKLSSLHGFPLGLRDLALSLENMVRVNSVS